MGRRRGCLIAMARSKVLYRKYRPTKLENVIGQEQITATLSNALKQGRIGHAYLFIGPRGTGKTSVARIFAHAVNGFDYQVEDHYLDIIEIDAASNTGVDNIRDLREKAVIAPTKGKYKVYIIDEVHMLTKSASNALLKTLEEPPEHVIFIMATTDAYKVPITISSRTEVHTFKLASPEIMQQHLRKIADAEKIPITDDAIEIVVRRGGGSFRDSLSLLDQISNLAEGEITAEVITKALGLPQTQALSELLQAYATQNTAKINELLHDLLNTGIKPEIIASELIQAIIQRPEGNLLPLLSKLPDVQPPFPEAKLLLAFLVSNVTQNPPILAPNPVKITPQKTAKSPETPLKAPEKTVLAKAPSEQGLDEEAVKNAPASKSKPQKAQKSAKTPQDFNWDTFIGQIQEANGAIYAQLLKTSYDFDGQTLHIYPQMKFTKNILEKPGNSQLLGQFLGGIALVVHDIDERKEPEDASLSGISAIMGGVQEVKDEMPF